MGESQRKKLVKQQLLESLVKEINDSIKRFQQRKGKNPTRIFLGIVETETIKNLLGEDPHKKCLSGTDLPLPVWTMKSARTMVDVG